MKNNLKRLNKIYHFETINEFGDVVHLDNKSELNPKGSSPMDLLLRAIAGCSSIDIVHILKKQRFQLDDIEVEVEGSREENTIPKVFNKIHLNIQLKGNIPPTKVKKAVDLSLHTYCSVAKILEKTAKIEYQVSLNGETI